MNRFTAILILFLPISLFGQSINGKVYDNISKVKNINIYNLTKRIYTHTDDDGNFKINATVNDTLLISSEFYIPKEFIVKSKHFETTIVIEVEKKINSLDQVNIYNTPKATAKNAYKNETEIKSQLSKDIKNSPYLYQPSSGMGMDFIKIAQLLIGVFKKKDKNTSNDPISLAAYDTLFNTHDYINYDLLFNELNISQDSVTIFFKYCHDKKLENSLLSNDNQMILLDSIVRLGKEFKAISKRND